MFPTPLNQIRCFLLDMDGTFYLGERLLPGALEFTALLKQRGTPYLFLTNNSSKSRRQYADKIARLGLPLPEDAIFTSGEATAIYLHHQKPGARLFVAGTPSLEAELSTHGFSLVQADPDYVVLGFDTTLTYQKLWTLCDFVRAGVPYIATHPDINCPTETGYMPDIGALIAAITASTGRQPDVIVGKPNPPIVQAIADKTGLLPNQIAMVGDRLYTDIALGAAGLTTVLVLSGETHRAEIASSPIQPDYVMENLAELAAVLSDQPIIHS